MGTNIRMAARGLLAAAAVAGLAGLGVAVPAAASSLVAPGTHSVSPRSGPAGTRVTITGSGFARVRAVRFRGVAAVFKVRSASRITAVVPAMPSGAGRITVTTRAGTARSRARFTVTPRIVLSPAGGPPGSVVTVSGTGFGATERVDVFAGTTDEALAGTGAAGSFGPVRVTIPAKAVPGTAWISAEGRHSRLFAQAAFTVNTDWAQFRSSPAHTGTNPYENVLSRSDVARLALDWSVHAASSFTDPAVANGTVYIGSSDAYVYAFNAATGARRWRSATPGSVNSNPAVANGTVYVGMENGCVCALNAATGNTQWSFEVFGNHGVNSSPAVANGVVYIGSNDDNLYAVNAATGAELWSSAIGNPEIVSSPAVANGTVYIGSTDGNLYALNAATGAILWIFTTGGLISSSPAVVNGTVYIDSTDGNLYALNAATGAELWTFTSSPVGDPAVANGVVYIGSADGHLYALNAATGAILWSYATGGSVDSPAVANAVVYISSADGHLYALDAATGAILWTYTTGPVGAPAVADGMVYAGSGDGHLYAFALPSGPANPARPSRNSLHPDYSLPQQR